MESTLHSDGDNLFESEESDGFYWEDDGPTNCTDYQ